MPIRETARFQATDDDGHPYLVAVYTEFHEDRPHVEVQSARKRLLVTGGVELTPLGRGRFQIPGGQVLSSEDPKAWMFRPPGEG